MAVEKVDKVGGGLFMEDFVCDEKEGASEGSRSGSE